MAARNTARKRAFQILFEGDQRGADVLTVLADWIRLSRDDTRQPPVSEYTMQRLGAYALLWVDETPDAVVLDEMVQLAKEFSTDESPSFVNGLLGRLKELKPSLRREA